MVREIIWTKKAKNEITETFRYWLDRNQSNTFNKKLNGLIEKNLKLLSTFPRIGRKTDIRNVRVRIIQDYLLFYKIDDNKLFVLTIRHNSRNLETLNLR